MPALPLSFERGIDRSRGAWEKMLGVLATLL